MSFFKNLLGLGVAAGAAYVATKVVKKYQENKIIEQMTAGDAPIKKETSEIIGDVAKATTEVIQETGEKVMETISDVKEKLSSYDDEDLAEEITEDVIEMVEPEEKTAECDCGCEAETTEVKTEE